MHALRPLFFLHLLLLSHQLRTSQPTTTQPPLQSHPVWYLVPTYNPAGGASNQVIEFQSMAVIARELNRTLCLPDFNIGPSKHLGPHQWHLGLKVSERFDLSLLARFTLLATSAECESACGPQLDAIWQLAQTSRPPYLLTLRGAHMRWTAAADIRGSLGALPAKCAAVSGVFPGLRWHGSYMAVAPFLKPAPNLLQAAEQLQRAMFGNMKRYLAGGAVHWRFDESRCNRQRMGLCFLRCSNGAENSEPAFLPGGKRGGDAQCGRGYWIGVGLSVDAIVGAVVRRMQAMDVRAVFIATDGGLRGEGGCELIREVVTLLRRTKVRVAGLWSCPSLRQANGWQAPQTVDLRSLFGIPQDSPHEPSNTAVSLVEQVMCERASAFMGSPHSTWSLQVWRARESARLVAQLWREMGGDGGGGAEDAGLGGGNKSGEWEAFRKNSSRDSALIASLMNDTRMAGGECVSSHYGKMYPIQPEPTLQKTGGHGIDMWLDYVACEQGGGNGSSCQIPLCL